MKLVLWILWMYHKFRTIQRSKFLLHRRCYRIVPLETFLRVFASDRSHMVSILICNRLVDSLKKIKFKLVLLLVFFFFQKKEDNTWLVPPPDYPPISSKESTMNLPNFISMSENLESKEYGTVLNEQKFKEFCNLV